ncbi:hypothetical protein [Sphingobacterium sp.]|uniref:hypothetical protein n=1 Tax=Sphingobacterium sp. TaxID=341027 RepID=UPI0031D6BFB4
MLLGTIFKDNNEKVLNIFKTLISKFGIDGAIGYTLIARLLQAMGGIISLVFIVTFLTTKEQGYYYTFGSILALQIFFELGFSGIIVQYVAHEASQLRWKSNINFDGDVKAISRISSLLRFAIKWFAIISLILFFVLLILGIVFFNVYDKENGVDWKGPWTLLSLTTSLSLLVSPLWAFIEGLGRVKDISKLRFIQQVVQLVALFLFFLFGLKLYAAPLASVCSLSIGFSWFFWSDLRPLVLTFWNKIILHRVDYIKEIFPFQWKIALSWISGYFIFQLFNPVLFATEGPVVAGQMGMSIAVLNAILSLTLSWMTTKVPVYSDLIATKRFDELDKLFNRTLFQSTMVNLLGIVIFLSSLSLIKAYHVTILGKYFGDRFLSTFPLICMTIPILINHIVNSLATYLRCHKKEPMLFQSIGIGILCAGSTVLMGKRFGVNGIALGYCIITVISLMWTISIFLSKRKEWHDV